MSPMERTRMLNDLQNWMDARRDRLARQAEGRMATYRARVSKLETSGDIQLTVKGTFGGASSNYGRGTSEPGWADTCQELLTRR